MDYQVYTTTYHLIFNHFSTGNLVNLRKGGVSDKIQQLLNTLKVCDYFSGQLLSTMYIFVASEKES